MDTTAVTRPRREDSLPGYRLERVVGRGGMGEVWRAMQLSLGRTVAVKLLADELAVEPSFVTRFQKEAAALATLRHPHIVSIVDQGQSHGLSYLVMEFVDGPSLREVMRAPNFDALQALRVTADICRAIDYAHGRGVVHRDLKPENILFDEQAGGIAKVTDFGLAAFLDETSARFALTQTAVAMGTLSYMAPEQRVDAKKADARADVFSLGVILYELLTGELPLGTFELPSKKRPGIDPALDEVVSRCLKPDPDDRYRTAGELLQAIEAFLPHTAASATRIARVTRMQRVTLALRRAVVTATRAAALLLVLAAAGVLGVAYLRSEVPAPIQLPGAALAADLGPPQATSLAGRLEDKGEGRRLLLGEGPDQLSVLVAGRALVAEDRALVFPPVEGQSRVGRALVDVVALSGDAVSLSAQVSATPPPPNGLTRVKALVFGPPPAARAALVLHGTPGRYVALVLAGDGAPPVLEWALGERRGTLVPTLPSPEGLTALELAFDEAGVLRAWVGQGRDRRLLAEPLHLGKGWMQHFGDPPQPGIGCLEGSCRVEALRYDVVRPPPPAAAPAPPAPEPQPAAPAVARTAEPARVVPASAPAPRRTAPAPATKRATTKLPVKPQDALRSLRKK